MDHAKCIALIKLYKSKEQLWNPRSPYNRMKTVREKAWREISEQMKMPLNLLKRKMTILLASYRSEKYRMKKSRQSGCAALAYESKWFAFKYFDFMADKSLSNNTGDTIPNEYRASDDTDTAGFDSHDAFTVVGAQEISLPRPPETSVADRSERASTYSTPVVARPAEQNHTLLREVFDILKSSTVASTDTYVTYGQHITNELRKYDATTLAQVKHAINNVIFEADMGKYSNGHRRAGSAPSNPIFTPTIVSVLPPTSSMSLAKQENQENEALEDASILDTPDYFS